MNILSLNLAPEVSIGNLITWSITLIGAGAIYQKVRSQTEASNKDIGGLQEAVKVINEQGSMGARNLYQVLSSQVSSHESRLNNLDTVIRRVESGLNDLKWMKSMMQSRWGFNIETHEDGK